MKYIVIIADSNSGDEAESIGIFFVFLGFFLAGAPNF